MLLQPHPTTHKFSTVPRARNNLSPYSTPSNHQDGQFADLICRVSQIMAPQQSHRADTLDWGCFVDLICLTINNFCGNRQDGKVCLCTLYWYYICFLGRLFPDFQMAWSHMSGLGMGPRRNMIAKRLQNSV